MPSYQIIGYLDDIPQGWRLLSVDEFLDDRSNCLRTLDRRGDWAIALLSDGKCDGRGYGGKGTRLSRDERREANSTHMGDVMITNEAGGEANKRWAREMVDLYNEEMVESEQELVDDLLTYSPEDKGALLVSSCPGDAHGGAHTRCQQYADKHSWSFAPVQFPPGSKEARDWQRHWKIKVDDCLSRMTSGNKRLLLEVKINGGGRGCEEERSKSMTQWWIDTIKRLGADIADDLDDGEENQWILIGQVVVEADDFCQFANRTGNTLSPVRNGDGVDFELHYVQLNKAARYWCLMTNYFVRSGSGWRKCRSPTVDSGMF